MADASKAGQPVRALDALEKVDLIAHRLYRSTQLYGSWTPADQLIVCEALVYLGKSLTALVQKTDPGLVLPDVLEKAPGDFGGPANLPKSPDRN